MLETILRLARIFEAEGHHLYMVGGCVRDLLLHRETSPDVDMTTDARPEEIKRLAGQTNPLVIVVVGEQFGTVRLHYPRLNSSVSAVDTAETTAEGELLAELTGAPTSPEPTTLAANTPPDVDVIEITTFRSDRYDPASRKPEVTFGDRLEDDLLRRDFTINAMARDPLTGEIIDPYGGRDDLDLRLIRAVGNDPERRFDEDPLRLLRAVRFAAQLGFLIEERTAEAIERQAATLGNISRERIRDEFTKVLVSPDPMRGLRLLVDYGLMDYIVPEVMELRGVSQRPVHSKDVYEHVLRVVANTPPRPAARWAGLMHDIAKPRTRSVEDGKVHFFGHEDVGAVMTRDVLRRLKFDRPFIEHVTRLVRMHMRANAYTPDWTDGAVRRLMLEAGDALPDLLDLSRADITSYRPERVSRAAARVAELEARARWLQEEATRVPIKSPLDGNELMALFGRGPGPWLRPLKDHLLGLVIDGLLAHDDKITAEAEARRFLAQTEGPDATTDNAPGAE
jgi:poly(A) polymerase